MYMVFVDKVWMESFKNNSIFEIVNVRVFNIKFKEIKELSEIYTEYYKNGFWFSYNINMTTNLLSK